MFKNVNSLRKKGEFLMEFCFVLHDYNQLVASMAEQNIWRKQAKMNQMKNSKGESPRTSGTGVEATSPINQYLKNTNNTTPSPPWAKSNTENSNGGLAPWAKNNNKPQQNTSGQPGWANNRNSNRSNGSNNSKDSNSPPPWVKTSRTTIIENVGAKNNPQENAPSSTGNQPPWAKQNSPRNQNDSLTKPPQIGVQPPWVKPGNDPNRHLQSEKQIVATNQVKNVPDSPKNANNQLGFGKNSSTSDSQPPGTQNTNSNQTLQVPNNAGQPSWVKNQAISGGGGLAPWAKNSNIGQNNSNSGGEVGNAGSQAAWAKNNNNLAPWAKKSEEKQVEKKAEPVESENKIEFERSFTKPIDASDNKPAWVKNAEEKVNDGLTTPPWMKSSSNISDNESKSPGWAKREKDSPSIKNNTWKMKQSQQIQLQKKELEEQIRKQEEEEREQRRLQRQKRQREEEDENIRRQFEQMSRQDQRSMENQISYREDQKRQKQNKEKEEQEKLKKEQQEEQERKKQEEQKQRQRVELEEKERKQAEQMEQKQKQKQAEFGKHKSKKTLSGRKRKSVLQTSKISHISSIKGFQNINGPSMHDPSLPEKIYHKYLRLINEETIEIDYKKKIEYQKSIYQLQLESRKQCETEIINLFASRKITNRKRKFIFSNSMQIQYALCQGRNQQSGLSFESQQIQQLKTRFLQYELLTKCVFNLIKKKINIHLRVPLLNYAQYKGVSFLVEHVCQELVDIIEIQVGLFQQIANQVLIFEKQLELSYQGREDLKPITKDQLMVKKISIYGDDYYILYIKNIVKPQKPKKKEKENNILAQLMPKYAYLNDLSVLEFIIGKNSILPYYQTSVEVTKDIYDQLQKVVPPALKNILHGFCLARAIKTVYSSCQGEVDEESFFKLVIEGNKQMWDMIVAAGSPDRIVPKPFCLAYLEKLSSVRFNFSKKMFSRKKKELVKGIRPTVYIQRHDYELFEFIKNLEKYIEEDKEELVEQSLTFSRQLWQDLKQGDDSKEFNFIRLKTEVSYLLYKQKESQAVQMIDEAKQQVGDFSLQTIPIFLLALKIYVAKDMQMPLLKTFSDMLPILEFYFGEESMLHASVYTVVANYYSKKTDQDDQTGRSKKVVTFYQHALNIALKLYGQKGIEVADIYLNRASAFVNLAQYENFEKDIQQALKIYKSHSKCAPKIAECNHLIGRVKCLEGQITLGIELMEMSSRQFLKMYSYMDSLLILFEMLPFLEYNENELEGKIEKIVEICFTYKSVWAFKRIVTLVLDRELNCYTSLTIQNLQDLFHPLEPDDRTNEQILIDLEEEIKGFTSFIEIVRWALSIIAGKLAARREATTDYEKANIIIREIFTFYGKNQPMLMDSKDLNSQLI